MGSINQQIVQQRLARVYDTMAGAQGTAKHVKEYDKAMRDSVGLKNEAAKGAKEFLKDFGGGI